MKRNKSPGLDHLTLEHFVYASDRIVVLLTICFMFKVDAWPFVLRIHGHDDYSNHKIQKRFDH